MRREKEESAIDESEVQEEVNKSKKESKKEKKSEEVIQELLDQVEAWKNKYYQAYADCDNLRKSYEKDHQQAIKYRAAGFLDSLLPVLDSFFMVLKVKPEDEKLANYLKGFEMIYKQLFNALEGEGVKEICPEIGTEFDLNTMHAVDVKVDEQYEPNKVLALYSKGYFLKDRLIRPAMVVVSKKAEEESEMANKEETKEETPLN